MGIPFPENCREFPPKNFVPGNVPSLVRAPETGVQSYPTEWGNIEHLFK